MKRMIFTAAAALLLASCGGSASKKAAATASVPDMHTAETSLDYQGTYTGTIPAADCPGIEMRLTLKKDGTYDLHAKYIDRDSEFDEKGIYVLKDNLLTLSPAEDVGEEQYYKVEENRLRMLNADRQPVTGELADKYILTKKSE